MLTKFSSCLQSWATGRNVLVVLAAIVLFVAITSPLLNVLFPAGEELTSLDGFAVHTPSEIYSVLDSWGDAGRTYQLWFHLTWDLVFPVLGFLLVGLTVSWLLQRSFPPTSRLQRLNLVALGSGFDLLENAFLVAMVLLFPERSALLSWGKTVSTVCKYCYGLPLVVILGIGIVKSARNRFRLQ